MQVSPDADSVIISVNPKAGRRSPKEKIDRLVRALEQLEIRPTVMTDLVEVAQRANQLHEGGRLRALVGVGGDGTAAELVNRTEQGVPVALLPGGTANLLSRYLKWQGKPERLAKIIADGRLVKLDAGRASGRLFLVMISCGFDADVVKAVHTHRETNSRGGHISKASYIKPILDSIRTYRYPTIGVESLGGGDAPESKNGSPEIIDNARWLFAFNLPCYGAGTSFLKGVVGLPLTPNADGADGLLDVCSMSGRSLFGGLKYVMAAQCGAMHQRLGDCTLSRAKKFRITSDEPVPYQLDGDPGGVLPVDVEVLPNRLTLVVPQDVQKRLNE